MFTHDRPWRVARGQSDSVLLCVAVGGQVRAGCMAHARLTGLAGMARDTLDPAPPRARRLPAPPGKIQPYSGVHRLKTQRKKPLSPSAISRLIVHAQTARSSGARTR